MGSTSLKLALLLVLCLWTSAILAAPTTTIKPIDDVQTEKSTKNELVKPALAPESRSNADNVSEEDLDGRSAYINNRYVADEDMDEDIEQNQPLYEILQKQMEHVLAATGPDVPHYGMESGDDDSDDSLQRPPNKPIFELQNEEEDVDDYPEDEQDGEDIDGQDTASQEESEETAPTQSTTTSTNKPKTTKRKHTVIIMRSTKTPHRIKTTSTTPTITTKSATPTTTTTTTELPTTTTSTSTTTTTERPITSSSTSTTPPPPTTTTSTTTHKPKQQPVIPPNSIYPINTDVYNHKRRIIFKTISTGSQFVNSPIGDLMIKFSIGFAKPPAAQLAARSSASVNEALKTLSGNLIKQLNANALHKKHKRVKKSQNGEKIH